MKNYNFLVPSGMALSLSSLMIALVIGTDTMGWILPAVAFAVAALFFARKDGVEKGKREGKKEWYGRPIHTGELPRKIYQLGGNVSLKNEESFFVLRDESPRITVAYGPSNGGSFAMVAGFFAPHTLVSDQSETVEAPSSVVTASG